MKSWGYCLFQGYYLRNVDDDEVDVKKSRKIEIAVDLKTELQVIRNRDLLFGHEALGQSPGKSLLALILHVSGCQSRHKA